jgi:hypothetical protein
VLRVPIHGGAIETRSLPSLTHVLPRIRPVGSSHLCRASPDGSIHSPLPVAVLPFISSTPRLDDLNCLGGSGEPPLPAKGRALFVFRCGGGRVARRPMLPAAGTRHGGQAQAASTGETSLRLIAAVSTWSCAWIYSCSARTFASDAGTVTGF